MVHNHGRYGAKLFGFGSTNVYKFLAPLIQMLGEHFCLFPMKTKLNGPTYDYKYCPFD